MSNAKVNPFYIQDDEEDPWDDDEDEYDNYDYDDEQVMLMSGSGGIKNRKYNANSNEAFQRRQQQLNSSSHFNRSYHNSQYSTHNNHFEHKPQIWKYGFLLATILGLMVFGTSVSSDSEKHSNNNVSLSSLIDEIPNKEISHDDYKIVVLGERHSGTAWMRERLRECFPHVEVSDHLQRMGYFFQDDEATARSKAEESEALPPLHHSNTTTIVVHVTLNVYDWLEQMRMSPEYAPDHAGKHEELNHPVPLGWKEFLQKPWTTERPETDLKMINQTGPVCQMGFEYDEVVSCSNNGTGIGDPMYELYENGQPFGSIIELRTAKLQNHHGVLESWPSVQKMIQVSYESTAKDFKTKLLHEILEFTGWSADLPCSGSVLPPSLERSKDMSIEFVEFVSERADWETEKKVASYGQWTDEDMRSKKIRSEADSAENATEDAESSSTNETSEKQPEAEELKESDTKEVEDSESDSETTDNDAANDDPKEETTADESQTETTANDTEENKSVDVTIEEDESSHTEPDEKVDETAPSTKDVDEDSTVTEDSGEKDDSLGEEDKELEEGESNVPTEVDAASSSNAEETSESETESTNSEEEDNVTDETNPEEKKDGDR